MAPFPVQRLILWFYRSCSLTLRASLSSPTGSAYWLRPLSPTAPRWLGSLSLCQLDGSSCTRNKASGKVQNITSVHQQNQQNQQNLSVSGFWRVKNSVFGGRHPSFSTSLCVKTRQTQTGPVFWTLSSLKIAQRRLTSFIVSETRVLVQKVVPATRCWTHTGHVLSPVSTELPAPATFISLFKRFCSVWFPVSSAGCHHLTRSFTVVPQRQSLPAAVPSSPETRRCPQILK